MLPDEPETGHKKPQNDIERKDSHDQGRRKTVHDHAYDEKPKRSEDKPQKKSDD
jgi:hypothetical protein